jgi:lipopolysaccharide transport system permease protein
MIQHVQAVWRYRHFWLSLVRLDLRNRYRRSVLGIGWSLLHPLAMTAIWCAAFSGILATNDWRWYAQFLLAGMTVWEFIKCATIGGCESFVRAEAYIRQCPLPFSIYPLRLVLGCVIHFVIGLAMTTAMIALFQESWTPFVMLAAITPALMMCFAFCWGTATLAAFAHVYFHDTKHLFDVVASMMFFLTPIMYTREVLEKQNLGWVADLNPVNLFLELIRTPLMTGTLPTPELYTQAGVLTAFTVAVAAGTLSWLQKRIVFQL